jgi:hypothetical protein
MQTAVNGKIHLELFHRRINKLFDRRAEPVNLINNPDEHRILAPISFATTLASVVLPRPGGP